MIGISIGLMLRSGTVLSNPYVPGGLGPSTASYNANQTAGTGVFEITGLVSDEYVTSFTPNDGRLALAGGGRRVVVGLTASTGGGILANFYTNKGRWLQTIITINASTLTLQSIGKNTLSGVRVNPIVALNPAATITAGNSAGHFAISSGSITVTSAGDAADLNLGPYTLTIAGDSNFSSVVIPIETSMNWYSVTTSAELVSAYNATSVSSPNKVEVLDGVVINPRSPTDVSQTHAITLLGSKAFTGVLDAGVDGFTGGLEAIKPRIKANGATAVGSYTGGYCEITCRTKGSAEIDQKLTFPNSIRGVILTNISYTATALVTLYVPTATTKWLPNQIAGFSGGLTPGTNEIDASIAACGIIPSVTRTAAGTGGTSGTYNWTTTGGGGSGATGTFTVSAGAITTVTTTNSGSGYTGIPTVVLDPTANLTGAVLTATLGYNGGTGYVSGEAWTWTDGVDTISGTITASAGVITGGVITSKTAGIDAKMTGPVLLTTAASGNGIRSTSGVNGTLAITHDNYSFGPPPGAALYSLLNNTGTTFCQIELTGTPVTYPSQATDIIVRNNIMGGYRNNPGKPKQWINLFGNLLRWSRNIVVEDNWFHGFRNGVYIGYAKEAHIRRNDYQQNYEDANRMFESGAWPTPNEMNAAGADDFANSGTQSTIHFYLNNIHNNIDITEFKNLHSDGAQFGTFVQTFGCRGYIWDNRCVMPSGSTQGIIYNDDAFSALGGFTFIAENNLCLTGADQANAIVAFRGNTTRTSQFRNNTLIQLLYSQNAFNGASVVRRGNGSGYYLDSNIYGSFWNDAQYSYGGVSITTPGTGYVTGDKIIITNAYGVVGYGTLTAPSGAITGVTWTVEPTGFGSVGGLATATTDFTGVTTGKGGTVPLSFYSAHLNPDANTWCRLYSDTGTGGKVTALSGALDSEVYVYGNGIKNFGYGQNAYTVTLVNNTSIRPVTANTGAGTSLPELFNGSFTRVTGTYTGWSYADVDHTPSSFRATIDAVFTPRAGSAAVGKGHLAQPTAHTADTTALTADSSVYTADAA